MSKQGQTKVRIIRVILLVVMGLPPAATYGGSGVRVVSGLEFEARRDSVAQADYLQLSLDEFSLSSGEVIACADLQLRVPAAAGKEIELWPVLPSITRPWAGPNLRETRKQRRIGFVSMESGEEGFVRFDLTDLLQGWSVETQGIPNFYLRLRDEEEMQDLAPREVFSRELVLHTLRMRAH